MGPVAIVAALLLLNVWAMSFVARRFPVGTQRTLLFALIWLIPGGFLFSVLFAMSQKSTRPADVNARMLDAIAEKHRQIRDSK